MPYQLYHQGYTSSVPSTLWEPSAGHVGQVVPDGICPAHVAYCIEGVREGLLQGKDVLDHCHGGCSSHCPLTLL